jgi:hypothetical protein
MITYKLLKDFSGTELPTVKRSDGMFIPTDPANTDYIAYLKWIEEGNVPTPADA